VKEVGWGLGREGEGGCVGRNWDAVSASVAHCVAAATNRGVQGVFASMLIDHTRVEENYMAYQKINELSEKLQPDTRAAILPTYDH
jgi:hypothetical protein